MKATESRSLTRRGGLVRTSPKIEAAEVKYDPAKLNG
jgi:hypothetical protein